MLLLPRFRYWSPRSPLDAIKWALSGFQDGTVWLIFVAFMFALGYEKTGLGRRVALNLVRWLGKKTLGLRICNRSGGSRTCAIRSRPIQLAAAVLSSP